jgi:hypothetical protein
MSSRIKLGMITNSSTDKHIPMAKISKKKAETTSKFDLTAKEAAKAVRKAKKSASNASCYKNSKTKKSFIDSSIHNNISEKSENEDEAKSEEEPITGKDKVEQNRVKPNLNQSVSENCKDGSNSVEDHVDSIQNKVNSIQDECFNDEPYESHGEGKIEYDVCLAENGDDIAKDEANLAKDEANLAKDEANLAKDEANLAKDEANLVEDEAKADLVTDKVDPEADFVEFVAVKDERVDQYINYQDQFIYNPPPNSDVYARNRYYNDPSQSNANMENQSLQMHHNSLPTNVSNILWDSERRQHYMHRANITSFNPRHSIDYLNPYNNNQQHIDGHYPYYNQNIQNSQNPDVSMESNDDENNYEGGTKPTTNKNHKEDEEDEEDEENEGYELNIDDDSEYEEGYARIFLSFLRCKHY